MDEPVRKLLMAVGALCITISLIYIGYNQFHKARDVTDAVTANQDKMTKEMLEHDITKYEGYSISGATAISYIKSVVGQYDIHVSIITVAGTMDIVDTTHFTDFRDINSSYYINPMMQYSVTVERDNNDVIVKVVLRSI